MNENARRIEYIVELVRLGIIDVADAKSLLGVLETNELLIFEFLKKCEKVVTNE